MLSLWLCCAARYRGVVYGWDRRCERSSAWAASNRVAPDQPFYFCLPDEGAGTAAWPSCPAVLFVWWSSTAVWCLCGSNPLLAAFGAVGVLWRMVVCSVPASVDHGLRTRKTWHAGLALRTGSTRMAT